MTQCAQCAAELIPGAKFCPNCAAPAPALAPPFAQAEANWRDLKAKYDAGALDAAAFKAAMDAQMVDHGGRYWMLGVESGQWYVHDGQAWTAADAPTTSAAAAPEQAPLAAASEPVPTAAVERPGQSSTAAARAEGLKRTGWMFMLAGAAAAIGVLWTWRSGDDGPLGLAIAVDGLVFMIAGILGGPKSRLLMAHAFLVLALLLLARLSGDRVINGVALLLAGAGAVTIIAALRGLVGAGRVLMIAAAGLLIIAGVALTLILNVGPIAAMYCILGYGVTLAAAGAAIQLGRD